MPSYADISESIGTAAAWTSANPTLLAGQIGIESDTKRWKTGDGTTAWNSLEYSGSGEHGAEDTVASATSTAIGATVSQNVSITGTTTITGFGTVAAGIVRFGRFTGILTLTHNATSLILPGGVNITTAAGDRFIAVSLGSGNWQVVSYTPATGLAAFPGIPLRSFSADTSVGYADNGIGLLHPSADTTARTVTIPANASVPLPIGFSCPIINQNAAGALTIAITTDTMRLAGAGTTGSRTLAANGIANAIKITSTEWIISGTGLT